MNFYYNTSWEYTRSTNREWKYNTLLEQWNMSYSWSTHSWSNLEQKISLLQNSISSYSGALALVENPYTQKNMEFVTEKLRVLQEQQKKDWETKKWKDTEWKKWEKKQWWESWKQEQNTSKSSPKGEERTQEKKWEEWEKKQWWENWKYWEQKKQWNKWKEWETWENWKSWEKKWLSEKTKKILEQKAKDLQQQQSEIWKFYNKNYKEKNNSPFDNFADIFGRSAFDNWLLDDNQEKDW